MAYPILFWVGMALGAIGLWYIARAIDVSRQTGAKVVFGCTFFVQWATTIAMIGFGYGC